MATPVNTKDCAECRESLKEEINAKVDKRGVKWFVGLAVVVVIAVWGGGYSMYASGKEKRDKAIEKTEEKVAKFREVQVQVVTKLGHLEEQVRNIQKGQRELNEKIEKQTELIIKAIKERNGGG